MLEVRSPVCNARETGSLIKYNNCREFGRSVHNGHQHICDALTAQRILRPIIAETPTNCRSTYLLRINSNGKLVAAAHGDRSVAVYCTTTGRLLTKCVGHERSPWTIAFHPSQPHILASGCLGGNIRLWDLEHLINVDTCAEHVADETVCTNLWKHAGAIASVAFDPVHPILVAAWAQEVVFYDWMSGRLLSVWRFVSNLSRVRWVKFAPDGSLLYTATANPCNFDSNSQNLKAHKPTYFQTESHDNPPSDTHRHSKSKDLSDVNHESNDHGIPRDHLLDFLVRQPNSWFHQLGVCLLCSVRLCRWAGTLGPIFPTVSTDIHLGMSVACRAARVAATTMMQTNLPLSQVIQELLTIGSSGTHSEVYQRLCCDANPSTVAVIEDVPVHEFLLSRGNYCSTPSNGQSSNGLCCGAHACDLIIMHRELMRHSFCRPCLSAFWSWASRHVAWWHWSENVIEIDKGDDSTSSFSKYEDATLKDCNTHVRCDKPVQDIHPTYTSENNGEQKPTINSPVGICIQCKAGISVKFSSNKLHPSSPSKDTPPDSPNSPVTEHTSDKVRLHNHSQAMIPLAALDLLRSRLSNANDLTPITYLSADLIAEGLLSDQMKEFLISGSPMLGKCNTLPKVILDYLEHSATEFSDVGSSNSTVYKRRKIDNGQSYDEDNVKIRNALATRNIVHLAEETGGFGTLIRQSKDHSWNRPRRAVIKHQCQQNSADRSKSSALFPYVSTGSWLLRPHNSNSYTDVSMTNPLNDHHSENDVVTRSVECNSFNACEDSMTACCQCGRIVPQTFPIDPQSTLSAIVCENLFYSEGQCSSSDFHKRIDNRNSHAQNILTPLAHRSVTAHDHPPTHVPERHRNQNQVSPTTPSHSNLTKKPTQFDTNGSGSRLLTHSSSSNSNNMFYLIDQTSGNSMLNAVNRSITEVITGLFVDMGEYGSANDLQDSTYRICRWELSLCDSSLNSPIIYPAHSLMSPIPKRSYLPMPANVAVSYNNNSLVVPHARLFNDSSICLSRDGRMLAAFVVPRGAAEKYSSLATLPPGKKPSSQICNSETLLAVYRLLPKRHRGQCLFARRFNHTSPVCLDFSPLNDFLAVGLASTRVPSATYSASVGVASTSTPDLVRLSNANELNSNKELKQFELDRYSNRRTPVASIFRLDRVLNNTTRSSIRRHLRDVLDIMHPAALNPVSSRFFRHLNNSDTNLDRWHHLLLSASSGLSLNTIVWNPNGSILYGTTKGLIVIMQGQSLSTSFLSIPAVPNSGDDAEEKDKQQQNTNIPVVA